LADRDAMTDAPKPTLWHLGVSHYSEKVRWALAYKGVEHERKTMPPGAHMLTALWLTRGAQVTFPILELDGETVGGSAGIIGALETRYPDPPLYPEDPVDRRRALDFEAYFDEKVGPAVRLVGWHHMLRDHDRLEKIAQESLPGSLRDMGAVRAGATRLAGTFVGLRFRVGGEQAESRARATVLEGIDRLESTLDGRDYLFGDAFSVADLTAASLLYPMVLPPEGPRLPGAPDSAQPFRDELRARPFWSWVERTFARHRGRAPAPAPA
jgi:glutathione S-transferase